MIIERMQEKVQAVTTITTPSGAAVSTAGMLAFNEWLALGGFVLALGSFMINWYYQHKRLEIERDRK